MHDQPLDKYLKAPPIGGMVRQKDKPWEQLGISRATWYRHDKPTEWRRLSTNADEAKRGGMSLRSYERFARVFGNNSNELIRKYVANGGMKLGMADYLLAHPSELRRFTAWHAKAAKRKPLPAPDRARPRAALNGRAGASGPRKPV